MLKNLPDSAAVAAPSAPQGGSGYAVGAQVFNASLRKGETPVSPFFIFIISYFLNH